MKDTGIEWLSKIPLNWSITKAKYVFKQRNEKGNKISLRLLSPTQRFGVIPQDEYEELTGMKAVKLNEKTDYSLLKTIHKGDYCISLRSFQGGFEYSEYEGVVSPAYQVFFSYIPIERRFFKYIFKDQSFIEKMNSFTLSLRDGKNIAFDDFGNSYIPIPPFYEQQKIADFLDEKCAEIDALTSDIQTQIETLEEYKKSVITEAVTKGLDPNVEMKDTGIEWIGKIPKEWSISRLKYLLETPMKYGATETGVDYSEDLPRYIRITDITTNNKLKEEGKLSLTRAQAQGFLLEKDTILFARSGGTVGKTFFYRPEYGKAAFAGYLISAIPDKSIINPRWVYYFTLSNAYWDWANRIFTQATIQNIGADRYSNLPITFPQDLSEQNKYIDYLDKKCSEIDNTISEKQQQLETLAEYKKSLIYEYVTGKREVA